MEIPTPPDTDNPIVVLRSISLDKKLGFLTELLKAHDAGDVDRAAKCASTALSSEMESRTVNAMVALVSNLAHAKKRYPSSLKGLMCKASDAGFHEFAYNAANQVAKTAKSAKDFKEAERLFQIAMSFTDNPATQAAAHVNYCEIIRDGLISGVPDWQRAVKIYETAARMGLVKAMFNAGNVCSWLETKGHREYGARAAYWFNYALEHRAAKAPTLDMESAEELEEVYEHCMGVLSGLHIDAQFDGADLEVGIGWAKELAQKGDPHGINNLGVGYIRRIAKMTAKPHKSPGANWRAVLSAIDWTFKGEVETETVFVPAELIEEGCTKVDRQVVVLDDDTISLFVTNEPCLPHAYGDELFSQIAMALIRMNLDRFFLVTRRSLFIESGNRSFSPIAVWQNGKFSRQSLWVNGSPKLLLQQANDGVDFLDPRFSNWSCMLPIAINALDEGFVVANNTSYRQTWVRVGDDWRMPFVDKAQLIKVGIAIE